MCTSGCRAFLWGGSGQSAYDSDGRCFCICEDGSWSDRNIFGAASCVPVKAHRTFSLVGLGVSVGLFCHSAYLLFRQRQFHQRRMAASTSPAERCRRQLHITSSIVAVISIGYFSLVLADVLRWSLAVDTMVQIPKCIGGAILTIRMWIYTNDPRLLRRSPELFAISSSLESPAGHTAACCVASVVPFVATILALANIALPAVRLMIIGGVFVSVLTLVVFWRCGRSLINAIDKSLLLQQRQEQQAARIRVVGDLLSDSEGSLKSQNPKDLKICRRGSHEALASARRKVNRMLVVTTLMVVPSCSVGLAAAFSIYLAEVSLIVDVLLTILPMWWLSINMQLHAGRSKQRVASKPLSLASNDGLGSPRSIFSEPGSPMSIFSGRGSRSFILPGRRVLLPKLQLVVPTEALC